MNPNILMPIMIFMIRYYNTLRHTHRFFSVNPYSKYLFRLSFITLVLIFASSCERGILKEGGDLLPKSDFVSVSASDTIHALSYLRYDDSVRTDNPQISYIGQEVNPYFGTTKAGFVTQIRLNPAWDGLAFTVDSMKLILHILSVSGGGSDVLHSISLYEISNQIYTDSAYYSSSPIPLTGFKVTDLPIPTLRSDTINDVVIKIPDGIEFGNYLIRDTSQLFYNNNKADFRAYFKGLYFQMDPSSDNLMLSLSLIYNQLKYYNYFVLYGHDDAGVIVEYSFNLDAKNKNAAFNVFKHDFTTATIGDKMAHRNTTYKDTLSYLQSLNGVYTKIELPGLEKLKSDPSFAKIAVNRAKLTIPVKFDSENNTKHISKSLPANLYLRYKGANGTKYTVPDYSMSASDVNHAFFDGKLDTVNKVYNFNIPAYVQAYLKDATDVLKPEVEVFESSGSQSQTVMESHRDVIFEANKSKTPVKFEFTYTKF
jgi:hypothetical protein